MYGFIYLTTNQINGKKYIGLCKNTHKQGYLGSGKCLKQAIRKYGKENFSREILEECYTFDELCEAEKTWIKKYNAHSSKDFYNISRGGCGGCSETTKDFWSSFTKEERKKLRKWNKPDMYGEKNPMYGRKHSEETKRKIGSKSKNRNWGRKTPYYGGKNPRAKKVFLVTEKGVEVFDCIKDISIKYGYIYSSIKGIYKKQIWPNKYGVRIVDA